MKIRIQIRDRYTTRSEKYVTAEILGYTDSNDLVLNLSLNASEITVDDFRQPAPEATEK